MVRIGCHLSCASGYTAMAQTALSIGAGTIQFFTRNPRGGGAKPIVASDIDGFLEICRKNDIGPVVAHAPYTLNPCSSDPRIRQFTISTFTDDLKRMENIPGNFYNFHPGSHVGQGVEKGIAMIADVLNRVMTPELGTMILLETMSGKGSEVGKTFEELRQIMDSVELGSMLGVCLDTCHVWDGGYDIVGNLDNVLNEFDSAIGLDRLKVIHLNGSLNPFGAHKDRHAKLKDGLLPFDALMRVVNHPRLCSLPFILETPNTLSGYELEIKLVKENAA